MEALNCSHAVAAMEKYKLGFRATVGYKISQRDQNSIRWREGFGEEKHIMGNVDNMFL